MAISKLERIYIDGAIDTETPGVLYFPILDPGTLVKVKIHLFDNSETEDAEFTIDKNGVNDPDLDLTVSAGNKIAELDELELELVEGDYLVLNFAEGEIETPLTLELSIDDGEPDTGGGGEIGYSHITDDCVDLDAIAFAHNNVGESNYNFVTDPEYVFIKVPSTTENWVEYKVDHLYLNNFLDLKFKYVIHVSGLSGTPFYIQVAGIDHTFGSTINLSGSPIGSSVGGWQEYEGVVNLLTLTSQREIKYVRIWLVASGDSWTVGLARVEFNTLTP